MVCIILYQFRFVSGPLGNREIQFAKAGLYLIYVKMTPFKNSPFCFFFFFFSVELAFCGEVFDLTFVLQYFRFIPEIEEIKFFLQVSNPQGQSSRIIHYRVTSSIVVITKQKLVLPVCSRNLHKGDCARTREVL